MRDDGIQGVELGTLRLYEEAFFDDFSHPNGENIVECGFKHLYLSSWQQLMLSSWWLRRFRFGPVEWAWRSFTYRKLQPFRREVSVSA